MGSPPAKRHYRNLPVDLWRRPAFRVLAPRDRLVVLALAYGPDTGLVGLFPLRLEELSPMLGCGARAASVALTRLAASGWVVYDAPVVWVPHVLADESATLRNNPKWCTACANQVGWMLERYGNANLATRSCLKAHSWIAELVGELEPAPEESSIKSRGVADSLSDTLCHTPARTLSVPREQLAVSSEQTAVSREQSAAFAAASPTPIFNVKGKGNNSQNQDNGTTSAAALRSRHLREQLAAKGLSEREIGQAIARLVVEGGR
jgi:hypothetical protein